MASHADLAEIRRSLVDIDVYSGIAMPEYRLRAYQAEPAREIARSVLEHDGRQFAIVFSRQAGKDELLAELDRARIVEPQAVPSNVVTMNSTVRFRVESSEREFSLTLVYPRDQGEGTISILAPVGSALLGMTEGDAIAWPKPGGGVLSLRIIEVTYQPERVGDFHR